MKKVLYIALAVQSVVLLGVVIALVYSALATPKTPVDPESAQENDGGFLEELVAPELPQQPEPASDGGEPSTRDGGLGPSKDLDDVGSVVSELLAGNERFARGDTRARDALATRHAPGRPKALVLGCSDAVVPVEQVFDQPLGALVVVRSPGHFVEDGAAAAVDDALLRQHVRVVVVLGHRACPTVAAALGEPTRGEPALAPKLRPALASLKQAKVKAVETNVSWAVSQLARRSKALRQLRPTILRAIYDESTGEVQWLDADAKPEERQSQDTP
jgi:carbonic anhydrase